MYNMHSETNCNRCILVQCMVCTVYVTQLSIFFSFHQIKAVPHIRRGKKSFSKKLDFIFARDIISDRYLFCIFLSCKMWKKSLIIMSLDWTFAIRRWYHTWNVLIMFSRNVTTSKPVAMWGGPSFVTATGLLLFLLLVFWTRN